MSDVHPESLSEDVTSPRPGIPRALVLLLGLAAVFLIASGIQPIRSTLAAAFLALNLVLVVWPIERTLVRFRVPRVIGALVAGLVALGLLGLLVWSIGWAISRLVQELPKYSGQYAAMITQLNEFAASHNIDANAVTNQIWTQISSINFSQAISTIGSVAASLTNVVTMVLMILMILFFMLLDTMRVQERVERLADRHNASLAWALRNFARGVRRYWVVTTIFGLVVATGNFFVLTGLAVPLAIVWAVFSFVTNYIPNIGFIIGLVPPVVMALLANTPWTALWVVVGYVTLNVVIQTLIQPKVAGDAVGITPTVAILSLLLWAYVLGPLGAILAIPATLLVKSLFIDIDPRTRWLNAFIAANPTTSDQDPMRLAHLITQAKRIRHMSSQLVERGKGHADAVGDVVAPDSNDEVQRHPGEGRDPRRPTYGPDPGTSAGKDTND